MKRIALALILIGATFPWTMPASSQPAAKEKQAIIATFSIAAVDPETGQCGAAVASRFPAVGKVVAHARAGVGAFCTQHHDVRRLAPKALDLLADKNLPEEVLTAVLKDDPQPGMRQLGIIDMHGRSAQRHPVTAPKASNYWGGMSGRFYVCQGNTLHGREVIVAMGKAYEETKGSLADRLMAALVAGDCAGGDHRGRLAAGIRVCKKDTEGYWLDLHVDKSTDAVIDLHKKYLESDHPARGEWGKKAYVHPCPKRVAPKRPD
ncbi:MAG: DUF1028 domain-containing protein [Planctomycetes bacterium]|nr:DUF1028 domain-containing protein [Planctomycetota bacterium]